VGVSDSSTRWGLQVQVLHRPLTVTPNADCCYAYLPAVGSAARKSNSGSTQYYRIPSDSREPPISDRTPSLPNYRHYRPKDLAVVRIDGRDHDLGPYGSPESRERYWRLVTDWNLSGAPARSRGATPRVGQADPR
jgi:hypothetical protein